MIGIVKTQFDAFFLAGLSQFLERIALEGSGFDGPISERRGEHAKPFVIRDRFDWFSSLNFPLKFSLDNAHNLMRVSRNQLGQPLD
jgi:hypothetical protein